MNYELLPDGALARFTRADGREVVKLLRTQGFKFGEGECGRGLYSPNWDRQLGYFSGDEFYLNPSLLHHLEGK